MTTASTRPACSAVLPVLVECMLALTASLYRHAATRRHMVGEARTGNQQEYRPTASDSANNGQV
jgi:hypothetical protein